MTMTATNLTGTTRPPDMPRYHVRDSAGSRAGEHIVLPGTVRPFDPAATVTTPIITEQEYQA